jgi:DNA-binding transcriptional MocR family regulator
MPTLGLTIDHESPLSLAEQIVAGVRQRVDDRILRSGMRLPPIRTMASALGVSRFTVVDAYDRLVASGLVGSRRGSGFYVRGGAAALAAPPAASERVFERAFDNAAVMRESLADDPQHVKVGAGWLPPGWLDDAGVRRPLRALTRVADLRLTQYGPPQGYAPLRRQLQIRLDAFGISAPPEQILLTAGATQALDIVARTLLRPGDCALVDDPGYWNLFAALRLLGVRLIGVPRGYDGPDVNAIEALLIEHRPKVFITQSILQNPTSGSIAPTVAHRLLELAARHDLLIVEDDVYADLDPGSSGHAARLATWTPAARRLHRQLLEDVVGQPARRLRRGPAGAHSHLHRRQAVHGGQLLGARRARHPPPARRGPPPQIRRALAHPPRRGNGPGATPPRARRVLDLGRASRRHVRLGSVS